MIEVRAYMPSELNDELISRCDQLNISKSEYIRILTNLDLSIQKYQKLIRYINFLHNQINDIHQKLGIHETPLQDFSIINLN